MIIFDKIKKGLIKVRDWYWLISDWVQKIPNWVINNYILLLEAFQGWDLQLEDFKEQALDMLNRSRELLHIVIKRLMYIVKEFKGLLKELMNGLGGWNR